MVKFDVNLSILFTELPLHERPGAARSAGFDAVEFWWPFDVAVPADRDVDAFVGAVRDAGVRLVGLNFFAGNMPGGDRGLVSWPARAAEFRDNVEVTVAIGEQLGWRWGSWRWPPRRRGGWAASSWSRRSAARRSTPSRPRRTPSA
jgi:hydroxypyruvate isomerase